MKDAGGHGSDAGAHSSGIEQALATQRPADPAKVNSFLAGAQGIVNGYYQKNFGDTPHMMANIPTLEIRNPDAPRYLAIDSTRKNPDGTYAERSAHAFIDRTTGDVLKPAGWKTPAKGVRGNIHDAANGLGRMGPHGPAYNK